MKCSFWWCFLGVFFVGFNASAQEAVFDYSHWTELIKGMEYIEMDAPIKSSVGDSKISILRMNPDNFEFSLHTATQYDRKSRSVSDWADTFRLNVVFNASMYEISKPLVARGYLKSGEHVNNGLVKESFRSMIALNPKTKNRRNIEIVDLTCESFYEQKQAFSSLAQGLRMINCEGTAMAWNKRNQSCSMMVAAQDEKGWFYILFCRSPYTHNQMIRFMKDMPFHLTNAIYLEGGPETSLLIDVNQHCIEKVGSWVSETYERDDNQSFWKLPNVIGVKVRNN